QIFMQKRYRGKATFCYRGGELPVTISAVRPRKMVKQGSGGESQMEAGPFAQFTFQPHFATMFLHDVFDNRQTQPGATLVARTRLVRAIESFENPFFGFPDDSRSV